MPTGYSGTPLVRKLGLKPGMRCRAIEPPEDYAELLGDLPDGVRFLERSSDALHFVHLFVREAAGLQRQLRELRGSIAPNGMIWVSWPKKASGVETDVNGNVVRDAGLGAGLVDIKICAVDDTWSGLKFVIPRIRRE
ncbi:MAG: DUF3052 family protein [Gemmatimonadota bacterium]|nr:DUF3052 family protein [Gemmatimonadota bacterium]